MIGNSAVSPTLNNLKVLNWPNRLIGKDHIFQKSSLARPKAKQMRIGIYAFIGQYILNVKMGVRISLGLLNLNIMVTINNDIFEIHSDSGAIITKYSIHKESYSGWYAQDRMTYSNNRIFKRYCFSCKNLIKTDG